MELSFCSKEKALELLGRAHAMFNEKKDKGRGGLAARLTAARKRREEREKKEALEKAAKEGKITIIMPKGAK